MTRFLIGWIYFFLWIHGNAHAFISREADPTSIVENVSAIWGDYSEIEVDLVVPHPTPSFSPDPIAAKKRPKQPLLEDGGFTHSLSCTFKKIRMGTLWLPWWPLQKGAF